MLFNTVIIVKKKSYLKKSTYYYFSDLPTIHCMGQNYTFFFYDKIIRILRSCSMKIFSTFPTINISKLNY